MPDLDYAVAVCGFGRCGTTMTMQMLVAGGLPPGNATEPPYEGDPKALIGRNLAGRCVKLLDPCGTAAAVAGPTAGWRFIWLDRDPLEQAHSYLKLLKSMAPVTGASFTPQQVANTYARDRPARITQLRAAERVTRRPRKAATLIRREIFPGLDGA